MSSSAAAIVAGAADAKAAGGEAKADAAPAQRHRIAGFGRVIAVTSGDSLVVQGAAPAGQAGPVKNITLSGLAAPRVARGRSGEDEPFGFEARNYLRSRLIGQTVHFQINHKAASGREYGVVTYKDQNVAHLLVQSGFVKAMGADSQGRMHPDREALVDLQKAAEARAEGLFAKDVKEEDHIRKVDWKPDVMALYQKYKGVPLPALVDTVREGGLLRVELLDPTGRTLEHKMLLVNLCGVAAPRMPLPYEFLKHRYERRLEEDPTADIEPPVKELPPPFAAEAVRYTESLLLHRNVQVVIRCVDRGNTVFADVLFHKGSIAAKLLETGLAQLVPWSAALSRDAALLTAAENSAKAARRRLWAKYDPLAPGAALAAAVHPDSRDARVGQELKTKVVGVLSGDRIQVLDAKGEDVQLIYISSIRCPNAGRAGRQLGQPLGWEAKEFARKKLIGHKVRVVIDYVRQKDREDGQDRVYGSVFVGQRNLALALVELGFATLSRHRPTEPRSPIFPQLLDAEMQAERQGKGVWAKNKPKPHQIINLTRSGRPSGEAGSSDRTSAGPGVCFDFQKGQCSRGDDCRFSHTAADAKAAAGGDEKAVAAGDDGPSKARLFLASFKRDSENGMKAVVEHVFNGSRMNIYVEKDNCLVAFNLSGVRCPRDKDAEGKVDPIGLAALNFSRSLCQQHSVKVQVEALDRGDNFIGSLIIGGTNLSVALLREGLGELNEYAAERSVYKEDLLAAEQEAKRLKKNMWENWDEEKFQAELKAKAEAAAAAEEGGEGENAVAGVETKDGTLQVKVVEITDAATFYVHVLGDKKLDEVEASLAEFNKAPASADWKSTKGEDGKEQLEDLRGRVVGAKFADGLYYRARVEGRVASGELRCFFIDFGNRAMMEQKDLVPLPAELADMPQCARPCTLAGVRAPSNPNYAEDAMMAFDEAVWEQQLEAKLEPTEDKSKLHLTLFRKGEELSVQRQLLQAGWLRVLSRPDRKLKELAEELQADQTIAIKARVNQFEYGDVSDDEPEEQGWGGKGRGDRRKQ